VTRSDQFTTTRSLYIHFFS